MACAFIEVSPRDLLLWALYLVDLLGIASKIVVNFTCDEM